MVLGGSEYARKALIRWNDQEEWGDGIGRQMRSSRLYHQHTLSVTEHGNNVYQERNNMCLISGLPTFLGTCWFCKYCIRNHVGPVVQNNHVTRHRYERNLQNVLYQEGPNKDRFPAHGGCFLVQSFFPNITEESVGMSHLP